MPAGLRDLSVSLVAGFGIYHRQRNRPAAKIARQAVRLVAVSNIVAGLIGIKVHSLREYVGDIVIAADMH